MTIVFVCVIVFLVGFRMLAFLAFARSHRSMDKFLLLSGDAISINVSVLMDVVDAIRS